MTRRTERIGSLIRSTLGELLLTKLSDPRVDPAKTSITRVEIQEDLLAAKVYVSVMGTEGEQRRTISALVHASGHVQELMARKIRLRNTPILEFLLEADFKKTLKTYELIQQAMAEIREKQVDDDDEEDEEDAAAGRPEGREA